MDINHQCKKYKIQHSGRLCQEILNTKDKEIKYNQNQLLEINQLQYKD